MKGTGISGIVMLPIAMIFFAGNVIAGESVGPRKITDIGCHNTNGVCYATLEGEPFGSTLQCSGGVSTEFRFENSDTDAGKRTYASLLAAFLNGRAALVNLDGCTSQGKPKLSYFRITG